MAIPACGIRACSSRRWPSRARFGGKDLYPGIADKAAALAFSLVKNHPFLDGNKRTGYAAMMMFLSRNGHTIIAPIDERESMFVSLAAGKLDRERFLAWVRGRIVRKSAAKSRGHAAPAAVPILLRPDRADRSKPAVLAVFSPDDFTRSTTSGPIAPIEIRIENQKSTGFSSTRSMAAIT